MNQKILITGANGQLGREFVKILSERNCAYVAPDESECDVTNSEQVIKIIDSESPDVIINCSAYNAVDIAEENAADAFNINKEAVAGLAYICRDKKILLIHYSTDYVFDGQATEPYREDDKTDPVNVYGMSKLAGEEAMRNILEEFLIFRLSWLYGRGKQNFLYKFTEWAVSKDTIRVSSDEISVPTYCEDVVEVTIKALEKGIFGLFHLCNSGKTSRYDFAKYYAERKGIGSTLEPVPMSTFDTKAKRPSFSVMSNEKLAKELGITIPTWQSGVDRYVERIVGSG
jgi:dTDP-4-dehydrorhamnose reductase